MLRSLRTFRRAKPMQRPHMMAQQTSCTWLTACTTQNYLSGLTRQGYLDLSYTLIL